MAAAIGYCVLGMAVSQFFAVYGLFPAPIWLPASIAVVAASLGGIRLMPGIFLGSFVVNYLVLHASLPAALLISLGNSLGPIIGAAVLARFRPARGVFTRFSGVVAFILCNVLLHPAITASTGTLALAMTADMDASQLYSIWVQWWLCDSGGTLCFAPALLLLLGIERETHAAAPELLRRNLAITAAVAVGAIALFATLPLPGAIPWGLPFLLVIPLSWVALRVSLRAAYSLVALVAVVAAAATVAGFGPFQGPGVGNPLQLVGVLIVLLALTVLTIVSLVAELREAEASSRAKSMLLAAASHDLRTPLNAMIGFADLMRTETWGPVGNPRYRKYVEHIHESGLLLAEIVNGVLDLTKIEAGRQELSPRRLDWTEVSEGCLRLLAPQAAQKGVILSARAVPGLAVHADEVAIRQILLNLLANAVKFTPEGGHVVLHAGAEADGTVVIEVVDDGIGMDAAGVAKALEPFGQVGSHAGGTGLGLPIAARLADLHGGRLTIASEPGRGTTVRVTFPPPAEAAE
ncbi:ATP-binding protein [Allostella humosa]|uniref:ATP-binding protein n=1 Tax=Stella humosa TaxID=94 RepID=UPI0014769805|nr:ATP-binding protein [Stella humosa]